MEDRTSGILKPGEAAAQHRLSVILRSVVVIGLASVFIGVALAQGLGVGAVDLTSLEFWTPVSTIATMTLLTVEVLKRRAPDLFSNIRGTLLSLGVGVGWGVLMHFSPSFRMFDSLTDSITYGAISGILASGVYDVAVAPIQKALAKVGMAKESTVHVITQVAPQEATNEPAIPASEFVARVAARDRTA